MKKKFLSLALALTLVFSLAVPAFASEYTVVKCDTLSQIALEHLGAAKRWRAPAWTWPPSPR